MQKTWRPGITGVDAASVDGYKSVLDTRFEGKPTTLFKLLVKNKQISVCRCHMADATIIQNEAKHVVQP